MPRKKRTRGPRKGVEQFTAKGGGWTFRKPVYESGKWRSRRVRGTESKRITLKALNITDAKTEVMELAEKAEQEAQRQVDPEKVKPEAITLEKAAEEWGKVLEGTGIRQSSLEVYKQDLTKYAKVLGARRRVADVTYEQVEKLFTKTWRAFKIRTLRKHYALLNRWFRWCVKRGHAKTNPVNLFEPPTSWKLNARRDTRKGIALTVEQAQELLKAAKADYKVVYTPHELRREGEEQTETDVTPPDWQYWFCLVALKTGLRKSNIVGDSRKPGLRWGDIDLEERRIFIPGQFMKGKDDFEVPMADELAEALEGKLKEMGRVPKAHEQIVASGDLRHAFPRIAKRAKLGHLGLRPHDLRHSFLSWLDAKAPRAVVRDLAGHTDRDITDRYSHPDFEALRKGINSLPWLVFPCKASKTMVKD